MVYEKRIRSLPSLQRELRLLDGDAGMRLEGAYRGKKCFAFATRFGETYTLMVFSRKGGAKGEAGRKLVTLEFRNFDALMKILKSIAGPAVNAYVY